MARRRFDSSRRSSSRHARCEPELQDRRDPLIRRAIRLCRGGEHRRAALVLRDLVASCPSAANWSKLGIALLAAGRHDQALDALKQGIWLHRRSGFPGRADALRPWVERARIGMASNYGWAA